MCRLRRPKDKTIKITSWRVVNERECRLQRIDALLDAPNPRKDGYWNPYDYKKLTAAIRRQSMEVSNILVGLRKPL